MIKNESLFIARSSGGGDCVVFIRNREGISRGHQCIKGRLQKSDCELTSNEMGILKMLQNLMGGGWVREILS